MNKIMQRHIEVCVHWEGVSQPVRMGILSAAPSHGKEIFSFAYDDYWLKSVEIHTLDPALQLVQGTQYAPQEQQNFGVFMDSSPDRWGRFLMNRREAHAARKEGRKERKLLESDYLIGVYDEHRMGALRFRTDLQGPFLDSNKENASPPWTSLRELEHASLAIEKEDSEKNPAYLEWLNMLIAPGGSLGGARPKASVMDDHKHLWIAKFPSNDDKNNIGAWEMLVYKLARRAKIDVSEAKLQKFNSKYHTFLSKRFDRRKTGERIHFASALTLLQRFDDDASNGASYLELAEFILKKGAEPLPDLEQLWRRIVFFICVSNVDDHLRNHGFIFQPQRGWVLSPAFDINPVANGNGLKLNISESDNSQDLKLAKEVAEYFHLKPSRVAEIIIEVVKVVKSWRKEASSLDISVKEQDRMERAFRIADNFC